MFYRCVLYFRCCFSVEQRRSVAGLCRMAACEYNVFHVGVGVCVIYRFVPALAERRLRRTVNYTSCDSSQLVFASGVSSVKN